MRAKELILRFLSGAPRIAEDLCADVTDLVIRPSAKNS
jgi:hypothetical protein